MYMIDEYFNIYNEYIKEYGTNTAVLYACGSFYEMYRIENDEKSIGNADKLSEILHIAYTSKNRTSSGLRPRDEVPSQLENKISKNDVGYNFCGFNTSYASKFISILLENEYTVVIVDQLESSATKKGSLVKRGVTAIHSPSLHGPDYDKDNESKMVQIMFNGSKMKISLITLSNLTNDIEMLEIESFEELDRVLLSYTQLRVIIVNNNDDIIPSKILNYFSNNKTKIKIIDKKDITYKEYIKKDIQNEYLKRVYSSENYGILDPITYLNMDKLSNISIVNFMYLLDFVSKHDLKYIMNLNRPKIIKENNYLMCMDHTLTQLNIIGSKSLFSIINNTSTSIGKRYLNNLLKRPFKDPNTIELRYKLTSEFDNRIGDSLKQVSIKDIIKQLSTISDIEKLHRKMGLSSLHPYELKKLDLSYNVIIDIIENLKNKENLWKQFSPSDTIINELKNYMNDYKKIFNIDLMDCTINTMINFYNKGILSDVDVLYENIEKTEKEMTDLKDFYESKLDKDQIKLIFTEQEGYHFVLTKIRFQSLLKKLTSDEQNIIRHKFMSSSCKFYTDKLTALSDNLDLLKKKLDIIIKTHYLNKLNEYYKHNAHIFNILKEFIEIFDITLSNWITKEKYNYCRPFLSIENTQSFICAKDLRHPIIERVSSIEYIPNDITLDKDTNGMLLYGLNSSGKSSLLRSIGMSIIMAQCGLYVPCSSFTYNPFSTIISQVDLTDDLFSGKSSFVTEMVGLKSILNCCGPNTLVLSDEMCKGTEHYSSISLVASTLLKLVAFNTKFFFTSHLHQIQDLEDLSKSSIYICHLNVITRNDDIIFERKIKEGSGSSLYGLEVAKSILQDPELIDKAFEFRNKLISANTNILKDIKKSKYNKKKLLISCEICNGTKDLEIHHIQFQMNCNEKGLVNNKHYHKNEIYNLSCMCHICHDKITRNKIIVHGYKNSLTNKFLDYSINE